MMETDTLFPAADGMNELKQRLVDTTMRLARSEGRLATLLGVCETVAYRLESQAAYRVDGDFRKISEVLRGGIKKATEGGA